MHNPRIHLAMVACFHCALLLAGCGGGGTPSSPVKLEVNYTDYQGPRSVRLNNFNNWTWPSPSSPDYENRLKALAFRERVVLPESYEKFSAITPQLLKSMNPNAKVFRLYDLCCKNSWDADWQKASLSAQDCVQTPIAYADIVKNDWWLRDSNGGIVKENNNTWLLDVGKPGFKEAYLANMLARNAGKGFDGFVLDYWHPTIPSFWFAPGTTYKDYSSASDWYERAWKPFIQYITSGLRAAGYLVVGNCAGTVYNEGAWDRTQVDGTIYEGWAFGWSGEWLSEEKIERSIEVFGRDPLEVWTADYGLRSGDPEYLQKAAFALAMYYVALPSSPGLRERRFYHHYGDSTVFWDNLWDFYIGEPEDSGPSRKTGEPLFYRRFSRGVVLLNYGGSKSISYTLTGKYRDSSGKVLSGTITIPPRTGLILAREG